MPVCEMHYFSTALQKQTAVNIILPPPEIKGPYHVMFLLHGLSDDQTAWQRWTSIERYMDGLPIIVAMPDGGRGFYCDAVEGFAYGTAIGTELPAILRHYFPTKPGWCVSGLSMGGYGAARLALSDPSVFQSAHSLSGAMRWGNKSFESDDRAPEFARILGKSPKNGPNDLFALAEKLPVGKRPKLRIDCGTEDFLIEDNRAFNAHLVKLGFGHEYEEFPGEHNWRYWDVHVQEGIKFHAKNLGLK